VPSPWRPVCPSWFGCIRTDRTQECQPVRV